MTAAAQGALLQHEAIELAYAVTARAAEAVGARALAIKGLVPSVHGLRAQRTPADVDILIEPSGFPAVSRQLEAWGWRIRLGEFSDFPVPHHSVTYLHDRWPCDIDAHHHFPGFLAPADDVFDALWERRRPLAAADRLVPMTDWAGSVAIMALHSARSDPGNRRHTDELRQLLMLSPGWTREQRSDLAALAHATGCARSLDAVWARLSVPVDPATENVPADDLAEWRLRLDGRVPGTRVWLRYLRAGGPRQAVRRLGTALWPPEGMIRASRPVAEGDFALFKARVARLAGALWKAPRNLLAMLRGGDNVTRNALDPHDVVG